MMKEKQRQQLCPDAPASESQPQSGAGAAQAPGKATGSQEAQGGQTQGECVTFPGGGPGMCDSKEGTREG